MFGLFGIVDYERKKDSVWTFLDAREIRYVQYLKVRDRRYVLLQT